MSYNGSGTFNINTTGQPVVAGTVISSSAFNSLTNDLATGLTTAITKDGQTTTTARITFAQGFTSSLTTDSSSVSTGSIITDGGMGVAKNLYVGGTLNVTGSTSLTNPVINNIKMGYSTTATAAGTTTLTVASNYRQFFTGSTTQTIVLPVTSTLVTGMAYEIENNSTGLLTVNSSGGNLVGTIPAGVCAHAVCIGTTLTTAADWDWDYISTTTITGTGANVLGTSPTITSPTLVTPALGTPASGVMTNVTAIPAAQITGAQAIPKTTLPTGSVLQVVNVTKTNIFTTTSTSFVDVTGLTASITPTSSSSKILVMVSFYFSSNSTSGYPIAQVVRNSTPIYVGDSAGSRTPALVQTGGGLFGADGGTGFSVSAQFVDSPATTSATTYKVQVLQSGGNTIIIGATGDDSNASNRIRAASSIVLMEISA
jgi:hypothetical protein